jgi:hypothetical protein
MIYPKNGAFNNDEPEIRDLYRKTHNNYMAGEQKRRNYNWTVDPTDHVFGIKEQKVLNGAATAIHYERQAESFPKTEIVLKNVEDFRSVRIEPLGRPKCHGQGQAPKGADHVFGIKSRHEEDPWNAARCI